ncbi:hypothetical protein [Bacillus timonensis]|uniref:hypothetical protein n=1 Tax=Bacillus timonensis TaxID=1033734 RepID=UPI00028903FF|nr:hypothetical protein [Bacillus timonensis]
MSNKKVINLSTKMISEWLNKDIEKIIKKREQTFTPSYVIYQLYKQYSFGYRHIFSTMTGNMEWALIARERLDYIDNNIELIGKLLKRRRLHPNPNGYVTNNTVNLQNDDAVVKK